MKKYSLTKETIKTESGVFLHRILAVKDFGTVKAGDLGGFIQSESNLPQDGNAWVSGKAQVFGEARVCGNAQVCGVALLTKIFDIFWASNVGSENGTLTVFRSKEGVLVTRGCFLGTVDEFLEKSQEVHGSKIQREYNLLIEVALSRLGMED